MSNPSLVHWHILGAGAIGTLWASYWRKKGMPVTLITPTPRSNTHIHLHRDETVLSNSVDCITIDDIAKQQNTIDHLLICTKAHHTIDAVERIKSALSPNALVIVLQNGLASQQLQTLLPKQTIYTAISTDGAYRTDKNIVVHAGKGVTYSDLPLFKKKLLPTDDLTIKCCSTPDITKKQWTKLAINCVVNPLTVFYHCQNGQLQNQLKSKQHIKRLTQEVTAIISALGHTDAVKNIEQEIDSILTVTANNYSSMYQDIDQGRDSEIDMFNGFLCLQAKKLGIPYPENKALYDHIKQR
ncbi:2-dehydropantoate 2-reductase [bacterium]|nr:2-dehydropantoate 2-reductase [bacterium]